MAIASLVLGILSIVFSLFSAGGLGIAGAAVAVAGIILSGKNTEEDKASLAKAGKACSIVGLVLSVVLFVVFFICIRVFFNAVGSELLSDFVDLIHYILD